MAKKNENHKEYWGRRTKELMLYADQHDIDFFKELEDIYGEAARELQKEIFEFYAKYAEDNKISYREAQQILRGTDLSDYRRRAKKYLETHDEELLSRLNQQYASSQVTRLEALQLETAYQAGVLQNSLAISFATYLKRLANHSYRKIMGGRSSSTLNKPALEQLIRT
ncbi:phage head morphogenesis protein, partial [Streptococcus oralis]|nr:phage head morphogenesis protein [Streptococcus oralis]